MANRTAHRPWERLTSMPPAARAGRQLGTGGRSRHPDRNAVRAPCRITISADVRGKRMERGRGSGPGMAR